MDDLERGVQMSGIDLSPRMVALARQRFPELRLESRGVPQVVIAATHG